MNAALRAVVRGANKYNLTVWGIYRGYQGLIEDKFIELDPKKCPISCSAAGPFSSLPVQKNLNRGRPGQSGIKSKK